MQNKKIKFFTFPLILWFCSSLATDKIYQNSEKLQKSYKIVIALSELKSSLLNMQSSSKGYLLYNDKTYLKDYGKSKLTIDQNLENIRSMIGDNQDIDKISTFSKDYENEIDPIINNINKNVNKTKASQINHFHRKKILDKINRVSSLIIQKKLEKVSLVNIENKRIKTLVLFLFGIGSFFAVWNAIDQKKKINEILQKDKELLESNHNLEKQVRFTMEKVLKNNDKK